MTLVAGVGAIGAAIFLVAVHALGMEGIGTKRNGLCIRPVGFCQRAVGNLIVTAQAGISVGKSFLVFGTELLVKSLGMARTAGKGFFLSDIVMVTIRTFKPIFFSMGLMGKNDPAAIVVHDRTRRNVLYLFRHSESGHRQSGQNGDDHCYGDVSLLQPVVLFMKIFCQERTNTVRDLESNQSVMARAVTGPGPKQEDHFFGPD